MNRRQIKYNNRDFAEMRQSMVNFVKTYFPDQINDFNESSPQMALIEAIASTGDVLSYYTDVQLQESLLYHANERLNLYNISQALGYKPKLTVPATVDLDIFQLLPAVGSGDNTKPDFRYALHIESNMVVSTTDTDAVYFYTTDPIDFRFSSSYDPTTITAYSVLNTGEVEYFLAKKRVKAVSGQIKQALYDFGSPKQYDKIVIRDANVSGILDIVDNDGNQWYEVNYLAQDLIPKAIRNLPENDSVLSKYRDSVPYILS